MNNVPWVSKYRPKSVHDVACQHNVTKLLKKTIITKNYLIYYYMDLQVQVKLQLF